MQNRTGVVGSVKDSPKSCSVGTKLVHSFRVYTAVSEKIEHTMFKHIRIYALYIPGTDKSRRHKIKSCHIKRAIVSHQKTSNASKPK